MFKDFYQKCIYLLHSTHRYRELPNYYHQELTYTDFSSNDYLNLSKNPLLIQAALEVSKRFGVGATGSRLLSGNVEIFQQFEIEIAQDKNTETALIFNSGFQTNISVLSTLLDKKVLKNRPLVFFDKLNHSSLYQAIFLANAEFIRYRHNDMEYLSDMLKKYSHDLRPKFIVTETIFSMDGDTLPIKDVVDLARVHHTFLYLDEAHATGITGERGYGLSTTVNLTDIPHIIMGTFSKAIGVSGGYIACDHLIREYLINCCPGFIFSTANSPLVVGAAFKAWKLIKNLDQERKVIKKQGDYFRHAIQQLGFDTGTSNTHIVPIILGNEYAALQAQQQLLKQGLIVSCIRPPTISPGSSRLRIALNASHHNEDVDHLIAALKQL